MDECYKTSFVDYQVKRCIQIGLLCVQNEAEERPIMPSVVLMLSSEDTVLPLPKKPGFFLNTSSSFSEKDSSAYEESTAGSITVTNLVGR